MGNVLIEGAIDGLRLIGIDVPSSAENFIEMLVNAGVDVVSEVPRIISFIEQLGSEAWSTIEQVATGMEQYGPVGYIEHLMDQAYEPHYQTVKSIHMQKQVMLNAHRTALTNFQTQVQALSRGSQSFTGQATTSSSDKLTMLTTNMSSHLDLLETSLTYDQQFFDDYSSAKADIANTVILELVFIGVFCVVVLLAPETVLVAAGGFAIALSSVELALLAASAPKSSPATCTT